MKNSSSVQSDFTFLTRWRSIRARSIRSRQDSAPNAPSDLSDSRKLPASHNPVLGELHGALDHIADTEPGAVPQDLEGENCYRRLRAGKRGVAWRLVFLVGPRVASEQDIRRRLHFRDEAIPHTRDCLDNRRQLRRIADGATQVADSKMVSSSSRCSASYTLSRASSMMAVSTAMLRFSSGVEPVLARDGMDVAVEGDAHQRAVRRDSRSLPHPGPSSCTIRTTPHCAVSRLV